MIIGFYIYITLVSESIYHTSIPILVWEPIVWWHTTELTQGSLKQAVSPKIYNKDIAPRAGELVLADIMWSKKKI